MHRQRSTCSGRSAGFTALGAEVVWTRQLSLLFGASVYTFSLILAVFLDGAGHRRLLPDRDWRGELPIRGRRSASFSRCSRWRSRSARGRSSTCCPAWQPTAQFLPSVRATPSLAFAFDALRCAFALLPATILWGASFPLTLACGVARFRRHVARINAINTGGALAGAIAFTLIGIPLLGSHAAQQALVAFAAISGTALLWDAANGSRSQRLAIAGRSGRRLAMWIVPPVPGASDRLRAVGQFVGSIKRVPLSRGRRDRVGCGHRSMSAARASFILPARSRPRIWTSTCASSACSVTFRRWCIPNPRSILIVGVGAGVTAGALSIHPEVERIVICEIEPIVPISARTYFGNGEPPRLRRSAHPAGVRRCAALPADD